MSNKQISLNNKNKKLNIILCSILIIISKCKSKQFSYNNKLLFDSGIFLTIKGKGTQQILNNYNVSIRNSVLSKYQDYIFNILPSEIFVNGKKIDLIDFYVYNLTLEENIIKIRFNQVLTNCNVMFFNLNNITNIIFDNVDTSHVTNMKAMFGSCTKLESIEFRNFDTSSVTDMRIMFHDCHSLTTLDVSNFKTSQVVDISGMFGGCRSLLSLNLTNFDTSSVIDMYSMFYGSNLISLDLSNWNAYLSGVKEMFKTAKNLLYCIKEINSNNDKIIGAINEFIPNSINNCSDICFSGERNIKLLYTERKCAYNCTDIDKFEYMNICNVSCPKGTHNISNNTCIKDGTDNFFDTFSTSLVDNYLEDISTSITDHYLDDISTSITDHYLDDISTSIADHYLEDISTSIIDNYLDDISTSITAHYLDNISTSITDNYLDDFSAYNADNYLERCSTSIVRDYISSSISFDYIFLNNSQNTKEILDYIEYFNILFKSSNNSVDYNMLTIRNEIINGNLDTFIFNIIENNKSDMIIYDNNILYQITSPYNQINNKNKNISNIDLGACENKLKVHYNISLNNSLLILKVDIFEQGLLIPIIEYEIYNEKSKEVLNLSICEDSKIKINIPVIINKDRQ